MNKDILFTNGCSFTWGGALEPWFMFIDDKPLGDIIGYDAWDFRTPDGNLGIINDKVREKLVWTHHLADLLECDTYYNYGLGCGSNQRIIRTTLEWLSNQDRETLNNTKAVIQLTEPSRYEYYDETNDVWARCKIDVCQQINEDPKVASQRNMDRLSTFTELEGIHSYLRDCMALDQIMKYFGIEYYVWNLINPFQDVKDPDILKFQKVLDDVCPWINLTLKESVYGAMARRKAQGGRITESPSSTHPGIEGHRELAEILYFYMLANF